VPVPIEYIPISGLPPKFAAIRLVPVLSIPREVVNDAEVPAANGDPLRAVRVPSLPIVYAAIVPSDRFAAYR
jgi:hypothetical protein